MSDLKNIVIVGGSVAGHHLANNLVPIIPATHRILVIDAADYAYWPIAALRAAVVPGWEDKITAPIRTSTFFAKDSPHQVIAPNKVIELRETSLVLEHAFEGSTEVPFFKCILATGSLQPAPMRPIMGSTVVETKEMLRKHQTEIAAAKKVLIIGGGPVGLELAGEIRDTHPSKAITIVHSNSRVLNPSTSAPSAKPSHYTAPASVPKLSDALEKELADLKIDLVLGDKVAMPVNPGSAEDWDGSFGAQAGIKNVKLASGKVLQADYVFIGVGNKPGSGLVAAADKGAVADNMVWVDEFLRVQSTTTASILTKNYYAIGDCCTTPGWKTSQGAGMDGDFCASNILNEIKGKALKKYQRSVMHGLLVPLGKTRGAGTITMPLLGTIFMPLFAMKGIKNQKLLVDQAFLADFKGEEKVPIPAF